MPWLVAGLRRWRQDAGSSLVVAALVLASAFVVGLAPRLLQRVDDGALRSTVDALPIDGRGIGLLDTERIAPSAPDPMAGVVAAGRDLESQLPASVRALVRSRSVILDTPRYEAVAAAARTPTILTLRIQPGALERVRFTAGRAPSIGTATLPGLSGGRPRAVYEVAVSAATAREMGVAVGDTIGLSADTRDPIAVRFPIPAAAEIVGIFDVTDRADPFWFGDPSLAVPGIRAYSAELQYVDAIALMSPAAYPRLFDETREPFDFRVAWRLDVDPARVTSAAAGALLGDLRRLPTLFPRDSATGDRVEVRTDLTRIVGDHLARWGSAATVLAVASTGAVAVGIAALALVAVLASRRRRQTVDAWTARGASRVQLVAAEAVEAAVVVTPPAIVAAGLAAALLPDAGPPLLGVGLCAAVALVTAVLLVAADSRAAGAAAPAAASSGRRSRRPAIEAAVVIVAVAGAYLLSQRAAPSAGTAVSPLGAPDPFVAAVPALVGIAAGLVAARAFRLPMRALGRLAAGDRGLVPVLGFRRSVRGGTAAAMLLVLMATTTIATFGAATLAHLDQASSAIAWHDAGADLHVSASTPSFPARVDLASVPGVVAVADVYRSDVPLGVNGARVELLAVDPAALERVAGGTPGDPAIGATLAGGAPGGVAGGAPRGTAGGAAPPSSGPLRAIVSTGLAAAAQPVGVGDTFDLSVEGDRASLIAVDARDSFPTIPLDTAAFVIVSRPALEAALGRALPTTDALVRAPGVAAASFEAAVRHSPIVDAVTLGIVLAALVAAAYAATALIAALGLASAARAVEAAHLRTLGLSSRQSVGLVLAEHLPAIALAFLAGAALGLATFAIVEPGLGLAALLGSPMSVPLAVEPAQLAALLSATALVTAASIAVGAALERSAGVATSIRRGIG